MIEVDARGLSCPEPMLRAQEALSASKGQTVRVSVSTTNARDNVVRVAEKAGRKTQVEQSGYDFIVTIA